MIDPMMGSMVRIIECDSDDNDSVADFFEVLARLLTSLSLFWIGVMNRERLNVEPR